MSPRNPRSGNPKPSVHSDPSPFARPVETDAPPALARRSTRPGRGRAWAGGAVAGGLVVALVGGGVGWAHGWFGHRSATSAAAAGTSASWGSPSTTAAPGTASSANLGATGTKPPTPSAPASPLPAQLPGGATVDGVRKHLLALGFSCSEEGQPGMASWLCTRYATNPTMLAYVGGANGRGAGRIALQVLDGDAAPSAEALRLQHWFATQALGTSNGAAALAALAKGTDQTYATATVDGVHLRGAGDGNLVAFVDGWVPDEVMPVAAIPAVPLAQRLKTHGYACTGGATCTRTAGRYTDNLTYRSDGMSVSVIQLGVDGPGQGLETAAASEVRWVLAGLQERDALLDWFDRHEHDTTGATGYADSITLDWYAGDATATTSQASFALRPPCWNDGVENC